MALASLIASFQEIDVFPITPAPSDIDERGLFIVQDDLLMETVLPLYSFHNNALQERPRGHGTTFRIDPWSRCATAYHVIEDIVALDNNGNIGIHPERRLVTLELPLSYGVTQVPSTAWQPLSGLYSIIGMEKRPLQLPKTRNACELAVMRLRPGGQVTNKAPYLPVKLNGWFPKVGDQVMAFGYAGLDKDKLNEGDARPIEQRLYGSSGKIVQVEQVDGASGRPWPKIWVEATWPSGMSGGPVFNEHGHVVGLVSSGMEGDTLSCATFFSGWDIPSRIFGSLDPVNPGRFIAIGVFDEENELIAVSQDAEEAKALAAATSLEMGYISYEPKSQEWMSYNMND
ncbi:serine protease [Ensifer adhaerens]|uniref:trypsin-like peptidase domain-containing protein n=1 Tax=Ensifer canadensis TaxID=555315 RepID=UPI0014908593|nr:serine protease [Ensifer canadensis]